jgi:hypothetical protein
MTVSPLLVVLGLEIGRGDKAADGMSMLKFREMRKRRVREGAGGYCAR